MELTNFRTDHPFAYWIGLIFVTIAVVGIFLLVLAAAASLFYDDIEEEGKWPES